MVCSLKTSTIPAHDSTDKYYLSVLWRGVTTPCPIIHYQRGLKHMNWSGYVNKTCSTICIWKHTKTQFSSYRKVSTLFLLSNAFWSYLNNYDTASFGSQIMHVDIVYLARIRYGKWPTNIIHLQSFMFSQTLNCTFLITWITISVILVKIAMYWKTTRCHFCITKAFRLLIIMNKWCIWYHYYFTACL